MKKLLLFIAFAMLAALTMVSCNNKPKEPTQEEVQEMKQALADSVLADIDSLADEFIIAVDNSYSFRCFELSEKEKKVKPDYLLDPSEADKFVTKYQKINALAFYVVDLCIRKLYCMPLEEAKEAIAKLAIDVNYPFDIEQFDADVPISERLKMEYEQCKDNGDIGSFWLFQSAVNTEMSYIISQNPELFYREITDEQMQYYVKKKEARKKALRALAKYDDDIAALLEFRDKNQIFSSDKENARVSSSVEAAKQYRMANKDKYTARRNAMLQ